MSVRNILSKIKYGINILVRIYVLVTFVMIGVYVHQKYFVDFEDLVKYTPTVFVSDTYENVKMIDFYSFVGTPYEDTPLIIQDALFCKNKIGRWERTVDPALKKFILRVDKERNIAIDSINNAIGPKYSTENANTIKLMREFGAQESNGDGFSITYNLTEFDRSYDRECRFKIYYETSTRFFDLPKSVNFFTHSITIKGE